MLRLLRADRLLGGGVLAAILLVWAVLLGFDAIVAFGEEVDEIGQGDYSAGTAMLQVLYTLPRRAHMMFPTAAVIGTLIGLGGLAATSELTALRAAGMSRLRIGLGASLPILLLTGLMMLNAETLGPWGEQRAQVLQLSAKSKDLAVARWSGLWAREGDTFLNARTGRKPVGRRAGRASRRAMDAVRRATHRVRPTQRRDDDIRRAALGLGLAAGTAESVVTSCALFVDH